MDEHAITDIAISLGTAVAIVLVVVLLFAYLPKFAISADQLENSTPLEIIENITQQIDPDPIPTIIPPLNQPPEAIINAPEECYVSTPCFIDGNSSIDEGNLTYEWTGFDTFIVASTNGFDFGMTEPSTTVAQGFTAYGKTDITNISAKVVTFGTVTIKAEISKELNSSAILRSDELTLTNNRDWVNFTFNPVSLEPGEYFLRIVKITGQNMHVVLSSESYPHGTLVVKSNNKWQEQKNDVLFQIQGEQSSFPYISPIFDEEGNYSISLYVEDEEGLTDIEFMTLPVYFRPIAYFSMPEQILPQQEVEFDASESMGAGGRIWYYSWVITDGMNITIRNQTRTDTINVKLPHGFYNATLEVVNEIGKESEPLTKQFVVNFPPVVDAGDNQTLDFINTTTKFPAGSSSKTLSFGNELGVLSEQEFNISIPAGSLISSASLRLTGTAPGASVEVNSKPLSISNAFIYQPHTFGNPLLENGVRQTFTLTEKSSVSGFHMWIRRTTTSGSTGTYNYGIMDSDGTKLYSNNMSYSGISTTMQLKEFLFTTLDLSPGQYSIFFYDITGEGGLIPMEFLVSTLDQYDGGNLRTWDGSKWINQETSDMQFAVFGSFKHGKDIDGLKNNFQSVLSADGNIPVQVSTKSGGTVVFSNLEIDYKQSYSTSTFKANATDEDEDILHYSWDFGDGNTALGEEVSHNYEHAGSYIVTLFVEDGYTVVSDKLTVTVEN